MLLKASSVFLLYYCYILLRRGISEVTHIGINCFFYSSQVVFVAISYLSQSSPQTADCGLSSAAAVTGWGKVSLQFMKVSPHLLDPHPSMLSS